MKEYEEREKLKAWNAAASSFVPSNGGMKKFAIVCLMFTFLITLPVRAQGPVTPPPPPVPTINPVDQANADAAQWDALQQAAIGQAQAAASQAIAAASQALAAAGQAQVAAQQEHAARVAAEQGLMNQAVESSHQAQLAAVQAVALGKDATQSASIARQQSDLALRNVANLKTALSQASVERDAAQQDVARWIVEAARLDRDRAAFAGALREEQNRADLYGKVAIGALALLAIVLAYMAIVLSKLTRTLHIKPRDRMVVLDERGRVKAQIEALQ
jgi:hypothetical protein